MNARCFNFEMCRAACFSAGFLMLMLAAHGRAASGHVFLWNHPASTVSNVPPGLTNVVAVSAGLNHALALREDGTAVSWGPDAWAGIPAGVSNIVSIGAGWLFSVALQSNGRVETWGLVDPSPPDLTNAIAIAAGGHQFCLALRANGTVTAWGYNGHGQTNVPPGLTNVTAIAAGLDHSMALLGDGTVVGWGGDGFDETEVPPGSSNVVNIAAGWSQSFALHADGTVTAWGRSAHNPAAPSKVVAVAGGWDAGQEFLLRDGSVYYGDPRLSNAVAIARGHFFALAITVAAPPASVLSVPLSQPNWSAGQFSILTQTRRGKVYGVEFQNSLRTEWSLLRHVRGDGGPMVLRDPNAAAPYRFYRILEW